VEIRRRSFAWVPTAEETPSRKAGIRPPPRLRSARGVPLQHLFRFAGCDAAGCSAPQRDDRQDAVYLFGRDGDRHSAWGCAKPAQHFVQYSTGKIDKLTIKLEPPVLTPEDEKRLKEAKQSAEDDK
jgi:hypothetical protein